MRITWSRAVHVEKEKRARTYKVGNKWHVISIGKLQSPCARMDGLGVSGRPLTGPHDHEKKEAE